MKSKIFLGVNLDHIATVREARGGALPNFKQALKEAEKGGADGITVHLREDRRHIQDPDVWTVKNKTRLPLNLEMSLAPEIVQFALRVKPDKACIVPEKRQELTTEGGLNALKEKNRLSKIIPQLQKKGIEVSLFVDASPKQLKAAKEVGSDFIELHTGTYANHTGKRRANELKKLIQGSHIAHELGLGVNAGHGLTYENVKGILQLPYLVELNIGHSIVARALFVGLYQAVREMKRVMRNSK